MSKINYPAFFALVVYPIFIISLVVAYVLGNGFGFFEVCLFLSGYYISNITVGVGLHRLWAHDSYKINKYVEFILVLLSAGTLQGPALSWASNHFRHHTYTDTELDPHSPLKYESKIKGFWWSHMGWMLAGTGSYKSVDKVTMVKLGRNKMLRWQLRYYWQIATFMNLVVPAIVGYAFGQSMLAAYAGFLFIGLGRAIQQQVTFFVNSLCHFAGTQEYTKGTSGDIWWLAFLLLGENWHNYHHAFPSDYRNGAKWYQMDVHKWIIYLMSVVGLASDLKRTAKNRVEAKMTQTLEQYIQSRKEHLQTLSSKVAELNSAIQAKMSEIEANSAKFKAQVISSIKSVQDNLSSVAGQLNYQLRNLENPQQKALDLINKQVESLEKAWKKIHQEIEGSKQVAS